MSAYSPSLLDISRTPYGAMWIAADADYRAALNDRVNGIEREPAMETAHYALVDIRSRILATPSVTVAEQAVKLMIFASGSACTEAEDVSQRKIQLAHLIAGDDFETAAAYSLMLDMIAMATTAPVQPVLPLVRRGPQDNEEPSSRIFRGLVLTRPLWLNPR